MPIPVPDAGQADHPQPTERARQLVRGGYDLHVHSQKQRAMKAMAAQEYLRQYYTERASHRANHARRIGGAKDITYAEAFQQVLPQVVKAL